MSKIESFCGLLCSECDFREKCNCSGCIETNGRPFGGICMIAKCCIDHGIDCCGKCPDLPCKLKEQLISEFNTLGISDMEEVTSLNALNGSFINIEFTLPGGQSVKFWDDTRVYLGNQICKKNSDRCYGVAADENYLLVCEYGDNGSDAEIVVYKKRG